ncbi:MAG: NADH dehydrogenase subunit J [uncultured bacterium]|nr:MAG: NADH dehydrogenase subunit J [uncultured bacterium]HBH19324.1 NADH-quinone oxidoreductase subunit J [Cyanobacteria bacterium UBA9579]
MDVIYTLFFAIISLVLIVSALGVIFSRSIVYSAVSLIVTFLSVAGIFILLNADFVAISQIIIYGVGITIILIFAIMLTGKESDIRLWIAKAPRTLFALLIAGCIFLGISFAITNGLKQFSEETGIFNIQAPSVEVVQTIQEKGTTEIIGKALFTKYILPFEVLSLLLLAAILGAVVIARKDEDNLVKPTTEIK